MFILGYIEVVLLHPSNNTTALDGEEIIYSCTLESRYLTNVQWYMNDTKLDMINVFLHEIFFNEQERTSTLRLSHIPAEYNGSSIYCQANLSDVMIRSYTSYIILQGK